MQYAWYLIRQNIHSVLKGDPSLAVELSHPHIEGTPPVKIQRAAVQPLQQTVPLPMLMSIPCSSSSPTGKYTPNAFEDLSQDVPPVVQLNGDDEQANLLGGGNIDNALMSTQLEIPTMDRGTYITDDPSGDEEAIQLPYILTPSELRLDAVTAPGAAGDLHSEAGLRAIMSAVLDYMMMLDDQNMFSAPVGLIIYYSNRNL